MKFYFSLSKRGLGDRRQLMLQLMPTIGGRRVNMRAKSGIYILEEFFDPGSDTGISKNRISARKIATDEVIYHRDQNKRLNAILEALTAEFEAANKTIMTSKWLSDAVNRLQHPETAPEKDTLDNLLDAFLAKTKRSTLAERHWQGLRRILHRYEGFIRATERGSYVFHPATVSRDDIEGLRDYLANEHLLMKEFPALFRRLMGDGVVRILPRSENTICGRLKKVRSFLRWCREVKGLGKDPFRGVDMGRETYGTPIYLTLDERRTIAQAPMPTKHLETQRDIFVFHCLVGCRVGDLQQLTEASITDGVLIYSPHKTLEGTGAQARVPLAAEALSLIERYRGVDKKGRLFPFISNQKYNDAIKHVLYHAGVRRMVEVRVPLTGEMDHVPIYEVASSHMARRTFIGNLYMRVQDPNLIGKMSGHAEGSAAFSRYRAIEDSTLSNLIALIE